MSDSWAAPVFDIEKTSYTVQEILEWRAAGLLQLRPDFQRGQVWKRPAKAFLIDTILRGYPIPPIHIRFVTQSDRRLFREIIDGQQRLSAVLEFIDGKYRLAKPRVREEELPPWAGLKFSQLSSELQDRIEQYSFRAERYNGPIDDELIREIFSRINIYSVTLSQQELRNGRYFGDFKQAVYRIRQEHREFFKEAKIFGEAALMRMLDAEFVSEVFVVQLAGMQDKKSTLESYYSRYDANWPEVQNHEDRFRQVIDAVRTSVGDLLPDTRFNRVALFYTLYCVVYHRLFGISEQRIPEGEHPLSVSPQAPLGAEGADRLRLAVQNLSEHIEEQQDADTDEEDLEADEHETVLGRFAEASSRQTDNIRPRLRRFQSLWEVADLSTV